MAARAPPRGVVLIDLVSPFMQVEYLPDPMNPEAIPQALMKEGPVVVRYQNHIKGIVQNPALIFPFNDVALLGPRPDRGTTESVSGSGDTGLNSNEFSATIEFFTSVFSCPDSVYCFPIFPMKKLSSESGEALHLSLGNAFNVFLHQLKYILNVRYFADFSDAERIPEIHFLLPTLPEGVMPPLRRWLASALLMAEYATDIDHVGFYCHNAASFLQVLTGQPVLELNEHYTGVCLPANGTQVLSRSEGGYAGVFEFANGFFRRNLKSFMSKRPTADMETLYFLLCSPVVRSMLLDDAIQGASSGRKTNPKPKARGSAEKDTGFTPIGTSEALSYSFNQTFFDGCYQMAAKNKLPTECSADDRPGYKKVLISSFLKDYAQAVAAGFWITSLGLERVLSDDRVVILSPEGSQTSQDFAKPQSTSTFTFLFLERLSELEMVYKDSQPRQRLISREVSVAHYNMADVRRKLVESISKRLRTSFQDEDQLTEEGRAEEETLEFLCPCGMYFLIAPPNVHPPLNDIVPAAGLALDEMLVIGQQLDLREDGPPLNDQLRRLADSISLVDNPQDSVLKESPVSDSDPFESPALRRRSSRASLRTANSRRPQRPQNSTICPSVYGSKRREYFRALDPHPLEVISDNQIRLIHGWEVIIGLQSGEEMAGNAALPAAEVLNRARVRDFNTYTLTEEGLYHRKQGSGPDDFDDFDDSDDPDVSGDLGCGEVFRRAVPPTTLYNVALRVTDGRKIAVRVWPVGFPETSTDKELLSS